MKDRIFINTSHGLAFINKSTAEKHNIQQGQFIPDKDVPKLMIEDISLSISICEHKMEHKDN